MVRTAAGPRGAPPDAGCTWAPEAVHDADSGDYLVFWASTTAADHFQKHRIWAACTRDFISFGEPFVFIDKPHAVIDTTIVHDGTAYHRFSKDESRKTVTQETPPRLAGPWREVPSATLAPLVGYEGPQAHVLEPAREGRPALWGLILDHYAKGLGYQPWTSTRLASGEFKPAQGFRFPFRFRHGSVLPLSAAELARLEAAYPPAGAAAPAASAPSPREQATQHTAPAANAGLQAGLGMVNPDGDGPPDGAEFGIDHMTARPDFHG